MDDDTEPPEISEQALRAFNAAIAERTARARSLGRRGVLNLSEEVSVEIEAHLEELERGDGLRGLFEPMGIYIQSFSILEDQLRSATAALLNPDDVARVAHSVSGLSLAPLLRVFQRTQPDGWDDLKALSRQIQKYSALRNALAHGLITTVRIDPDGSARFGMWVVHREDEEIPISVEILWEATRAVEVLTGCLESMMTIDLLLAPGKIPPKVYPIPEVAMSMPPRSRMEPDEEAWWREQLAALFGREVALEPPPSVSFRDR